jgi:hypothetical protein
VKPHNRRHLPRLALVIGAAGAVVASCGGDDSHTSKADAQRVVTELVRAGERGDAKATCALYSKALLAKAGGQGPCIAKANHDRIPRSELRFERVDATSKKAQVVVAYSSDSHQRWDLVAEDGEFKLSGTGLLRPIGPQ